MSFVSLEQMPLKEITERVARLRVQLDKFCPGASGLLVFSRLSLYYLSGAWANGLVYVPMEGEPVLLCRRGAERSRLDSPLTNIVEYKSYAQIPGLLHEVGISLGAQVAVEMNGLSWSMGELLRSRLPELDFVSGDMALHWTRAVKTSWELAKMEVAGHRHHQALVKTLPQHISLGMTEYEIAVAVWSAFFEHGHQGMMRMQNSGEEIFLGHVAVGDSGNYPSVFNGPLGLRGAHPSMLFMGYHGKIWQKNEPLVIDCGFCLEGYNTDKTQIYWAKPQVVPDEAKKAQDFCTQVQEMVAKKLVPGVLPSDLYRESLVMAEQAGLGAGFMGLDSNRVGFLGHGIGLAIDEWPVLAPSFDRPLQENMVLAIEPKVGIRGLGMVGVENTFVVTDQGGRCLTGDDFSPVFLA